MSDPVATVDGCMLPSTQLMPLVALQKSARELQEQKQVGDDSFLVCRNPERVNLSKNVRVL